MIRLRNSLRSFARDESGVLLVEFLILLPLLIWTFIALVVYWDVFRTMNASQKASYAISDLLSRQAVVTDQFLDGLDNVMTFLTPGASDSSLRITSFQLNEGTIRLPAFDADDSYCVLFSRSPAGKVPQLTATELEDFNTVIPGIPEMNDTESYILVETWVDYSPAFDIGVLQFAPGMGDKTFTQFIVTRPRFWRRVTLDGFAHGCPSI